MMTLVIGGSGSGKSAWAEDLLASCPAGKRAYYVAAMRVSDEESGERVQRHRRMRAGKGFLTLEQPTDAHRAAERMEGRPEDRAALLECVSNLTANEMFSVWPPLPEEEAAGKLLADLERLERAVSHLVVVTNNVFEDGRIYEETTMAYLRAMGRINAGLARRAERVVEVVYGIPLFLKGQPPAIRKNKEKGGVTGCGS